MTRKLVVTNALLWAAAIVASAVVGAPAILSAVLLPALAAAAVLINRPGSGAEAQAAGAP